MSLQQETYDRAIRLGKLVPREIIKIRYIEREGRPVVAPPPPVVRIEPPAQDPSLPLGIRPYLVRHEYPTMDDVLEVVSKYYEVSILEIKSKRHTAILVRPRHFVMYLAKELTLMSFPQIGRALYRDHSTTHHGVKKIERLARYELQIQDEIRLLKTRVLELMAQRNALVRL